MWPGHEENSNVKGLQCQKSVLVLVRGDELRVEHEEVHVRNPVQFQDNT